VNTGCKERKEWQPGGSQDAPLYNNNIMMIVVNRRSYVGGNYNNSRVVGRDGGNGKLLATNLSIFLFCVHDKY